MRVGVVRTCQLSIIALLFRPISCLLSHRSITYPARLSLRQQIGHPHGGLVSVGANNNNVNNPLDEAGETEPLSATTTTTTTTLSPTQSGASPSFDISVLLEDFQRLKELVVNAVSSGGVVTREARSEILRLYAAVALPFLAYTFTLISWNLVIFFLAIAVVNSTHFDPVAAVNAPNWLQDAISGIPSAAGPVAVGLVALELAAPLTLIVTTALTPRAVEVFRGFFDIEALVGQLDQLLDSKSNDPPEQS